MDQRVGWGREGVGVRRRRVEEREGGGREFVDDDFEEERRARGGRGRGGIAKNWGWNKTKERDLPPPSPRERRILKGEDPLNDLARYVRQARVDLAGFSWAPSILARSSTGLALGRVRSRRTSGHGEEVEEETDEEASRRRKRDEAFEVLNFSRIQPVRLKVVKKMRSGLLGREIGACECRIFFFEPGRGRGREEGRVLVNRRLTSSFFSFSSFPLLSLSPTPHSFQTRSYTPRPHLPTPLHSHRPSLLRPPARLLPPVRKVLHRRMGRTLLRSRSSHHIRSADYAGDDAVSSVRGQTRGGRGGGTGEG